MAARKKKSDGLTDQQRAIRNAVAIGLNRDQAARIGGVSKRTVQRWLEQGRQEIDLEVPLSKAKYRRFIEAIEEAEAEFESAALIGIAAAGAAGAQNWTAYAWLLERKYPERYAKRDSLTLESGDKPLVQLTIGNPDARATAIELVDRLAELASERAGADTGGVRVAGELQPENTDK